jgi:SAM-dependent methyltransferase
LLRYPDGCQSGISKGRAQVVSASRIFDYVRRRDLSAVHIDSQDRVGLHRDILSRRRMIREVFAEFHATFAACDREHFSGSGAALEIGAGASPMRDSDPRVLATDIVFAPHLDCVIDAQRIAFASKSVRAVFGQHCFHHIPDPHAFFTELVRILKPGGGAVLIEPYYGPVAAALFKRLFAEEDFDPKAGGWASSPGGPMSGANQALSYIVFVRDRSLFEARYPELEIVTHFPLGNYVRYLASGGLNFIQIVPNAFIPILRGLEHLLHPLRRYLALHHVVVIRKRGDTQRQQQS